MKLYGVVIMEIELHTFLPLALDGGVSFRAWTLSLVPNECEAGWDAEPVWMFSIKEQSNAPTGNRTMNPGLSSPLVSHYTD